MPTLPTTPKTRQQRQILNDRKRRERKARAIPTNSTRWRKIRAQQLARHPLCRHCLDRGMTTPATDVDHIDGNHANNRNDNYQSLCRRCHGIKTAKEVRFTKAAQTKRKQIQPENR